MIVTSVSVESALLVQSVSLDSVSEGGDYFEVPGKQHQLETNHYGEERN